MKKKMTMLFIHLHIFYLFLMNNFSFVKTRNSFEIDSALSYNNTNYFISKSDCGEK